MSLGAIAIHALRERELEHLGALVASRARAGERLAPRDEAWLSASLPARPGRILVGHCGAGATLAWLLARGWDVEAFDPSAALVRRARARAPRARIDVLDAAGFVDDARGPFDAVLVAGFDRALTATARASLLRACVAVCPRGPILLSWSTHDAHRESSSGARIGRAIAALRGLSSDGRDALALVPEVGPTCRIVPEELASIGARLGYRLNMGATCAALVRSRRAPERALEDVAVELLVDVMAKHGRHRMVARGGSMSPAIASGSLVEIVRCPAPLPGDVVAARVVDRLFVHRVVGTDAAGRVLLKGDACASPDGWVTPRDVLGRVASFDDGAGPRAVPPATPPVARWRRGLSRLERALRALA